MIGVDYDLFWTLNPKSLTPFIKAFELKKQYDDSISWLNGVYVQMAVASLLDKKSHYPKKPLLQENNKQKSIEMTPEEIKERMMRKMELLNQQFGK